MKYRFEVEVEHAPGIKYQVLCYVESGKLFIQ